MITSRVWAVSVVLAFLVACGGSGGSHDGGTAGGGGTSAGGGAGTSSGGSGGSAGNCQMCIACVQSNCATQLTACQADTNCNAIWQCAMGCTMTLNDCIAAHQNGVLVWGPGVAACANQNCVSNGCPY
jgi:hypothetical protein